MQIDYASDLIIYVSVPFIVVWTGATIHILHTLSVSYYLLRWPHLQANLVKGRRLATEGWMHQEKRLTRRYYKMFRYWGGGNYCILSCSFMYFLLTLHDCRPRHQPWKVPSSWESVTRSVTWAPSRREMYWCRISTWWKASFFPGQYFAPAKLHRAQSFCSKWGIFDICQLFINSVCNIITLLTVL